MQLRNNHDFEINSCDVINTNITTNYTLYETNNCQMYHQFVFFLVAFLTREHELEYFIYRGSISMNSEAVYIIFSIIIFCFICNKYNCRSVRVITCMFKI